ncbi:PREDICTED: uncharacterized protein LOC109586777 [Amphimedon queenslandica]|uniref:Immunoglobulin subtype domain-containing protein n=1 Tax=Amphimedon queenslandica TaxID=400682 RepID=A0AAN0JND5_AMPQE|nr:PREDICTED: uncharacterized protein LOC109586777 [Amphimedon queenslandica]|eukprot:XP_019858544.1 PREDICTED: uncharacterized protein LOC109586777 [Amphimedon queenslandica]
MLLQLCRSFLCVSLYLVILSSICTEAEFITQPVSLNTSLNSTVTFTCEAIGVSFIFFIVNEAPASQDTNANRRFEEIAQETINGTIRRRQLSVHAREINNNTCVYCFASPDNIRSGNATLTIQGIVMYQFNCVISHFFRSIR